MKNTIGFNLHPTKTLRYRVKNNKTLIFKSRMNYNTGISINDYPLINSDVVDKLTFLRNKGFTQYKFIGGNNSTAFNTPINKGDEVNIIINENSAYDDNFEYGAIIGNLVKTADEIFAPDQNGNYDISDYPAIPATTLLERLETFPTGSNNTIRINKDTSAKYVEGFRTENLLNEESFNGTINSVNVTYHNGVFNFNGTSTATGGRTNTLYKKFFTLPAGTYNYRIHWLSEQIVNRLDVSAALAASNDSNIISITNEGNKTFTLQEETIVYVGVSILEIKNYDNISFQIIISKRNVNNNYIHPIEKLDYVVAQANAKGYDITIANNESDVKLIEKVEFDGANYIDSGILFTNTTIPVYSDFIASPDEAERTIVGYRQLSIGSGNRIIAIRILRNGYTQSPNKLSYTWGDTGSVFSNDTSSTITPNTRMVAGIDANKNLIINQTIIRKLTDQEFFATYTGTIGAYRDNSNGAVLKSNYQLTILSVVIKDNLFIPANDGTTDGMVNLKDMSFHPLIENN